MSIGMEPRPYQKDARKMLKAARKAGERTALIVLPTGTGKTLIMALEARDEARKGGRVLIIAHRRKLLKQTKRALQENADDLDIGIVGFGEADWDHAIVLGGIQTLTYTPERIQKIADMHFTLVIWDECFVPGTLIDGRPIETIKAGDLVTAFNETTQQFEKKRVVRTFQNPVHGNLLRLSAAGKTVVCTETHPFYTRSGWTLAKDLQVGEDVCYDPASMGKMQSVSAGNSSGEEMGQGQVESGRARVLQQSMQYRISTQNQFRDHGPNQQTTCLGSHDYQQSYAQESDQDEGIEDTQEDRAQAIVSGGKWPQSISSSTNAGGSFGMADGSRYSNGTQATWNTDQLQSGHCQQATHDSHRSGWGVASVSCEAGSGSQEGTLPDWSRLDSVEVLERGSDGTFGGVCPDGVVYNFEVEDLHTYVANGFVVHNCHHLRSRTYQQLLRKVITAFHQGYTATPNWHGGGSVASILGNPVYEQPLKDMILDKYLATPRVKIFRTRTTLAGIALHNGEFDEGELSAVVNCRNRNELIAETFLREGCKGKPTLAFCVSRQHARDLAACFRDHGVSAEALVDDRNDDEREAKIHRYETRETNVLVSCQVIEEGFDAPQTEVLVMAAPTMSLPRHTQRFGRGTRMAFDKTEFWVLDFTDNSEMHDLDPVTIADVLDLPELLVGEDVIDAIKKDKKKKERAASEPQEEGTSPEKVERVGGEVSSQSVNVLKSFPWHKVRGGGYQLTVSCEDTPQKIAIMPNDKSGYDVALVLQEHLLAKKKVTLVEQGLALSTAQSIAEKKAKLLQAGKFYVVDPDAAWRKNAPTAPQRARLEAMHIPIPATAGQAEALLTKRFARRGRAKKQETTS